MENVIKDIKEVVTPTKDALIGYATFQHEAHDLCYCIAIDPDSGNISTAIRSFDPSSLDSLENVKQITSDTASNGLIDYSETSAHTPHIPLYKAIKKTSEMIDKGMLYDERIPILTFPPINAEIKIVDNGDICVNFMNEIDVTIKEGNISFSKDGYTNFDGNVNSKILYDDVMKAFGQVIASQYKHLQKQLNTETLDDIISSANEHKCHTGDTKEVGVDNR